MGNRSVSLHAEPRLPVHLLESRGAMQATQPGKAGNNPGFLKGDWTSTSMAYRNALSPSAEMTKKKRNYYKEFK